MAYNNRKIGEHKEKVAAKYLQSLGYEVLEYNYRYRQGEIDLICKEGEFLVFCEVKYRNSLRNGFPEEAVTYTKQRTISRCASHYLLTHGFADIPCRFDVISIVGSEIRVLRNAFDFIT